MSPRSQAADVGDIFSVDLLVEAEAQAINNVELYLEFDPAVLVVVDASGNPVTAIEPDLSALNTVLWNEVDNSRGQIRYDAGQLTRTPPSGAFRVATVHFKKLAAAATTTIRYMASSDEFYQGMSMAGMLGEATVTGPR
jgi:hypothetical protein